MQHLVSSELQVKGPGPFKGKLPVAPQLERWWKLLDVGFYEDVALYAFPATRPTLEQADQLAYYKRPDYMHGGPAFLGRPAGPVAVPDAPAIDPATILDLTDRLQPDGTLDWQVPAGDWTVLRFGRRSNGCSNRPAAHPVLGLDHDKFSKELLEKHFSHFCQKLIDAAGTGKPGSGGLVALHLDSWEMNAQNWSPTLLAEFKQRRGYDFTPWLPALSGRVVVDQATTERALWDFRLTIQELMLENYVGHFRRLAHDRGLRFSIEPYGSNPTNDLDLGALADVPMCEFWSTKYDSSHSAIEAASVAHTLGRPIVSSEAFTGHRDEKGRHFPGSLKNQADWALAMGVNHFQIHTFVHKALGEQAAPGMTMGLWGIRWDRGQTWWPMVGAFHRYLARSCHLLQQGTHVSDILYLTPEGSPVTFLPPDSALAGSGVLPDKKGYSFDGCSPGILSRMTVAEDGRIGVPGATQYRLLVLPRFKSMTPELLRTIIRLVESGATVVGYPPEFSPGLTNHPDHDAEVRRLAETLWGTAPYAAEKRHGKGRVILDAGAAEFLAGNPEPTSVTNRQSIYPDYDSTAALLKSMGVSKDFQSPAPLRFAHRSHSDAEIYYVSNPTAEKLETTADFRVSGSKPQLWHPITGEIRSLPQFEPLASGIRVPLRFEPHESYFVIFPKSASEQAVNKGVNFPSMQTTATIDGPWQVSFDPKRGGPESTIFPDLTDWTRHPERGIQYYSGIACYRNTFDFERDPKDHANWFLDLGTVHDIARVRLNGKELGVVWCAPWRIEITSALKRGKNHLEIEVANRWSNRLLGDQQPPDKDARVLKWSSGLLGGKEHRAGRYTFSTAPGPGELFSSGLLGPVSILQMQPE